MEISKNDGARTVETIWRQLLSEPITQWIAKFKGLQLSSALSHEWEVKDKL